METIECDIHELEDQIATELENLSNVKNESEKNFAALNLYQVKVSLSDDFNPLKIMTESNLSKLKSLELLNEFSLVHVENSFVTVRYNIPWTIFQVVLQFVETSMGFICHSNWRDPKFPNEANDCRSRPLILPGEVVEVLERMTDSYVHHLNEVSFSSGLTPQQIVLNVGSFVSRLQLIGKEITKLLRRFAGKFSWSESTQVMHLNLLFVHSKNTLKHEIVACFHINLSYPYTPIEVDLTGGVNTGELEQLLVKNAKPGIGYLTRSCDVISAFLRRSA